MSRDHVIYTDGAGLASGDISLFLAYVRHRVVAPHLAGAKLGSADEDARDWLIVDQAERLLYLAEADRVIDRHIIARFALNHELGLVERKGLPGQRAVKKSDRA